MRSTPMLFMFILLVGCLTDAGRAQPTADAPRRHLLMDYGWTFTTGDPSGAEAPG